MSFISFFKKKRIVENKEEGKESFETIKDDNIKNENYFCCSKCRQRILISLNPINFSLSYSCQNNHKESNIKYNKFYNDNYINKPQELLCQQCKQEKLNYNNILSCNTCHIQLCANCILKHKFVYSHTNFGIIDNSLNKCSKHNIDISQYCKTCKNNLCVFCLQKGENKNEHNEHELINFSDLIPDIKEMEKNCTKLDDKIKKNISIIDKINNWKKEILSLVDNIVENLNCEIMIYKMIIKNFNWKFLDYTNYLNYNEAVSNLEKNNSKLQNFMNSNTLIEETHILTDYLFEKFEMNKEVKKENKIKNIFSIINYNNNNNNNNNNDENEISNMDERQKLKDNDDIFENNSINNNEDNINITEILSSGNAILCGNKYIYSCSLDNNELKEIHEFKDKENDKKQFSNLLINDNEIIFKNIINLKRSLSNKYNNYNILLWKIENDIKKDKLLNLINNKENENKKDEESKKCENNQSINNNNNLEQSNNNNISNESNGCLLINDINNDGNNNNRINNNNIFNNNNNIYNNNNPFTNLTYDSSNIFNTNYNSYSNIYGNREEEEEYVYISRTGKKYHGRPTCGRMKSSTKVSKKRAEAMGLDPCLKCY